MRQLTSHKEHVPSPRVGGRGGLLGWGCVILQLVTPGNAHAFNTKLSWLLRGARMPVPKY